MNLDASKEKVAALTAPRNVVLVGASDRPGSWAARVWHNLNRYEFPGAIYLINPRRSEIWGQPCYPDFQALPQAPDHMVVLGRRPASSTRSSAAPPPVPAAPRFCPPASVKVSIPKPRRSDASSPP